VPPTPRQQLDAFLAKFDPAVAKTAKAVLAAMRARLPGAFELVYDNYNALAIGFANGEKVGDVVFSIAVYPRWVTLFFFKSGVTLPDPSKRLRGSGTKVRHVVLERGAATLDEPAIATLMEIALERAEWIPAGKKGKTIIKSVAAKQRPRSAHRSVKARV
jgi:hypothetical protein